MIARRIGLSLLVAALGLACRRVPAELPQPVADAEPARTGPFVEAQPEVKPPPPGAFAPVSAEIAGLYSCWFRHPYEYMFDRSGELLEINGKRHGMLTAGIRGILFYGDFNTCAGELTGTSPRSYSDLLPIEALAGVPLRFDSPSFEFAVVNPEFIAYARRNLLPPPDQMIDGVPVQLAYDRVFSRFFRLLTASLLVLLESGNIDSDTKQYLRDTSSGIDGIKWLETRYGGMISGFSDTWDGTTMTPPMATGFWLRRRADGSFAAAWHGLRDVLERYDPAWLAEQKAHFPGAAATLEQLPDPLQ